MKALTISQPYASLIADGHKWVENRTWDTSYRGPLAIHAGKGSRYLTAGELRGFPTGVVVATCHLLACFSVVRLREALWDIDKSRSFLKSTGCDLDLLSDVIEHGYTEGPYAWVLTHVQKLPEPVAATGKQGLWNWNQTSEINP